MLSLNSDSPYLYPACNSVLIVGVWGTGSSKLAAKANGTSNPNRTTTNRSFFNGITPQKIAYVTIIPYYAMGKSGTSKVPVYQPWYLYLHAHIYIDINKPIHLSINIYTCTQILYHIMDSDKRCFAQYPFRYKDVSYTPFKETQALLKSLIWKNPISFIFISNKEVPNPYRFSIPQI